MKKLFKTRFFKDENGAAAVESVFILPFMCVLYFGSQDLISLIQFNKKMTDVAVTVSDTVAQYKTSITRAQVTDIENAIALIMPPSQAANVQVDVYGYYMNGTSVTKRWSTKSPNATACAAPNISLFASMMGPNTEYNDVVVAVACMNYTPWVATFMGTQNILGKASFTLTQSIATIPYQSKSINCLTSAGGTTSCNEI